MPHLSVVRSAWCVVRETRHALLTTYHLLLTMALPVEPVGAPAAYGAPRPPHAPLHD